MKKLLLISILLLSINSYAQEPNVAYQIATGTYFQQVTVNNNLEYTPKSCVDSKKIQENLIKESNTNNINQNFSIYNVNEHGFKDIKPNQTIEYNGLYYNIYNNDIYGNKNQIPVKIIEGR